jgi:hypothetical protein
LDYHDDKSAYCGLTKTALPNLYFTIPTDCPLEDAPDCEKLKAELDTERALYESLSEMHEAAKKDWWAAREKLQAENDRLRELLDKALEEHIENALTFCPDGCWCREAERVLEGTK